MLTIDFMCPPPGFLSVFIVLDRLWHHLAQTFNFYSKWGGIRVASIHLSCWWQHSVKTNLRTIHNFTWTEQFALMSGVTDVVPAVFTRTPCVMNLITLPAPACLLWMALVIYKGKPRAISHLYVQVCFSVCVCVCVSVCACIVVEGMGLVWLLFVWLWLIRR